MSGHEDDLELERFRAEALKLRSVLMDRASGLPSYAMLVDDLRALLETRRHVGVVHVDVQELELVESLYGWQAFDRVVARAARVLRDASGAELPAASLLAVNGVGGDRFVAFVPDTHRGLPVEHAHLEEIARALRARLEAAFEIPEFAGLSPRLVFRTGVALLSENPFYRFERRVHAAVEDARTSHLRRADGRDDSWASELHQVIEDAAVSTLFQPVVELETGTIMGFEALARGPEGTIFELPSPMFALSERFGLSLDLDRLCRKSALRRLPRLASGKPKIFLNVLPGGLADPEWVEGGVAALLRAVGLEPADIVLEVSERRADADPDLFVASARRVREGGFGLALDDVGTGYATLGTLDRVRPDYLKMDVSLVRGIDENLIKQELLASLVQIARRMGAHVVAEGIETVGETKALRAAGARYGQGYLFARPTALGAADGGESDH